MNPEENQNNQPSQVSTHSNDKVMAILSYVGVLVLIPLITSKNDPFVKFHVQQGLILLVAEVAAYIIGMTFYPIWMIVKLVHLATFILSVIGIINVVKNRQQPLPFVGHLATHFKI